LQENPPRFAVRQIGQQGDRTDFGIRPRGVENMAAASDSSRKAAIFHMTQGH